MEDEMVKFTYAYNNCCRKPWRATEVIYTSISVLLLDVYSDCDNILSGKPNGHDDCN